MCVWRCFFWVNFESHCVHWSFCPSCNALMWRWRSAFLLTVDSQMVHWNDFCIFCISEIFDNNMWQWKIWLLPKWKLWLKIYGILLGRLYTVQCWDIPPCSEDVLQPTRWNTPVCGCRMFPVPSHLVKSLTISGDGERREEASTNQLELQPGAAQRGRIVTI